MHVFVELVVATGTSQNQTFEKISFSLAHIVEFYRTTDQQDLDRGGNTTLITTTLRGSERVLVRHGYNRTKDIISEAQDALTKRWITVCEGGLVHVRFGK